MVDFFPFFHLDFHILLRGVLILEKKQAPSIHQHHFVPICHEHNDIMLNSVSVSVSSMKFE